MTAAIPWDPAESACRIDEIARTRSPASSVSTTWYLKPWRLKAAGRVEFRRETAQMPPDSDPVARTSSAYAAW
jgi:hypothetical protein